MTWIRIGSIVMAAGIALGAFGAHGLRNALSAEAKAVYQTAVLYHFVHGLALVALGLVALVKPGNPWVRQAGWAFLLGIVLFSGSLYLLSVTGIKRFGMITPVGGVAWLAGWFWLSLAAR